MARRIRFFAGRQPCRESCPVARHIECGRAQDAPDAATFQINSRLVYLDIVVRDQSGHVIHGLTQQDFKIEEDGQPAKGGFLCSAQL